MWQSPFASGKENGREAAARYVREVHSVDRDIRWNEKTNRFTFSDAAWWYVVEMTKEGWKVYRTDEETKKHREYSRARRRYRMESHDKHEGEDR